MATRLFVERGLALQAVVGRPNLRIVSPQFTKAQVTISKPSYAAVPSYQLIQTSTGYRDLVTLTNYLRPFMRDVVLDPDTKNLYLRDPTANFVSFTDAASTDVGKRLDSNNFAFADTLSTNVGKGLADAPALTDEAFILLEILRSFSDGLSVTLDDSFITYGKNEFNRIYINETRSVELSKPLDDLLTVSEAIANSLSKPFANDYGVSDVFAKVVSFARSFDEAPTLTDTNTVTFDKVDSELIAVSESAAISSNKPQSEDITISEAFSRVAEFNRTFADAFVLDDQAEVDSFTKEAHLNKGNLVGLQETQAFALSKDFADGATLGDTSTLLVGKGETDSVFVAEELSYAKRSGTSSTLNASPFNSAQFNN